MTSTAALIRTCRVLPTRWGVQLASKDPKKARKKSAWVALHSMNIGTATRSGKRSTNGWVCGNSKSAWLSVAVTLGWDIVVASVCGCQEENLRGRFFSREAEGKTQE